MSNTYYDTKPADDSPVCGGTYKVAGVDITFVNMAGDERLAVAYLQDRLAEHPDYAPTLSGMTLTAVGDEVDIDYAFHTPKFDRIRRITGYLVGTTDRWNNAKSHELEDRVTHDTERATATIIHD